MESILIKDSVTLGNVFVVNGSGIKQRNQFLCINIQAIKISTNVL